MPIRPFAAVFPSALVIASIYGGLLFAEDAKAVFNSLYGERRKQVAATIGKADDLALAKDMLGVARSSTGTPELLVLLCDSAYELTAKNPDGYGVAAEAMTLLADNVAAMKTTARKKLIDVLTAQSRAGKAEERDAAGEKAIALLAAEGDERAAAKDWQGATAEYRRALAFALSKKSPASDEIKTKLEEAQRLERANAQIARLQERLLENATDAASATEAVRIFLLELDDPAGAARLAPRVGDAALKEMVALINRPTTELSAAEQIRVGEWYWNSGRSLRGVPQSIAYEHAVDRMTAALGDPSLDTLSRTKAMALQQQAKQELQTAAKPPVVKPKPVTLPTQAAQRYIPAERLSDVLTMSSAFTVENGVVKGSVGTNTPGIPMIAQEFEGRSFRFEFKMKARQYQSIYAIVDGEVFRYSHGHWWNSGTAVIGNHKGEQRLKGTIEKPEEFAVLAIEFDGKEVRYFYNDKLAHSDPVTKPLTRKGKFKFGLTCYDSPIEAKDFALVVDGKPLYTDKRK